jgi:hypothetical protein
VGAGGNYAFNVVTSAANTVIVNIPVSASGAVSNTDYIYVTNNSTADGTWSNIAMGYWHLVRQCIRIGWFWLDSHQQHAQ